MFNEYLVQGNASRQYARILSLLLSLRQACDHPFLLLSRARGLLKRQDEEDLEFALTQDMITKIYESAFREKDAADAYATSVIRELEKEKNIGQQVCPICCDPIGIHPVLTKCFHVFCESCIDLMAKQTGVLAFSLKRHYHQYPIACPTCRCRNERQDLVRTDYHLFEYAKVDFNAEQMWHSSTKIDFLLTSLRSIWDSFRADPHAASVQFGNILIFSQWVEMLSDIGVRFGEGLRVDRAETGGNALRSVRRIAQQAGTRASSRRIRTGKRGIRAGNGRQRAHAGD